MYLFYICFLSLKINDHHSGCHHIDDCDNHDDHDDDDDDRQWKVSICFLTKIFFTKISQVCDNKFELENPRCNLVLTEQNFLLRKTKP